MDHYLYIGVSLILYGWSLCPKASPLFIEFKVMEVSHYNLHPQLVGIVYNMMVFFYVLYSTSKVIMHAQVYK